MNQTSHTVTTARAGRAGTGGDPNESTQWTPVGSQPCPGATLSLAPPSRNAVLGGSATVTATLANTCGVGLQGASVHIAVGSGPDAGAAVDQATDANGQASFSHPGAAAGTDTLQASVTNPAGTITSKQRHRRLAQAHPDPVRGRRQ